MEWTPPILRFTDFLLVAHSAKFKMKYLNVKYQSWSCQDRQKLQNYSSSHYPTTIPALCNYLLQYETPLFRIHVFRTRICSYTSHCSIILNFKLGVLRHKKRRGLAFYTGTSCLSCNWKTVTIISHNHSLPLFHISIYFIYFNSRFSLYKSLKHTWLGLHFGGGGGGGEILP